MAKTYTSTSLLPRKEQRREIENEELRNIHRNQKSKEKMNRFKSRVDLTSLRAFEPSIEDQDQLTQSTRKRGLSKVLEGFEPQQLRIAWYVKIRDRGEEMENSWMLIQDFETIKH
jgi:hypothetical protein